MSQPRIRYFDGDRTRWWEVLKTALGKMIVLDEQEWDDAGVHDAAFEVVDRDSQAVLARVSIRIQVEGAPRRDAIRKAAGALMWPFADVSTVTLTRARSAFGNLYAEVESFEPGDEGF